MPKANKTEQATPRRRQKAREQGQVARSRDLIASLATIDRGAGAGGAGAGCLPASGAACCARRWMLRPSSEIGSPSSPLLADTGLAVSHRGRPGRSGLSWMVALAGGSGAGRIGVCAGGAAAQAFAAESGDTAWSSCSPSPRSDALLKSLLPVAAMVCAGCCNAAARLGR